MNLLQGQWGFRRARDEDRRGYDAARIRDLHESGIALQADLAPVVR